MSDTSFQEQIHTQSPTWVQSIITFTWYMIKMGLWLALALALVEISLRLFIESPPISYGYDEDWGYYPAEGTFIVWGSEGYGINYFDNYGEQVTAVDSGLNIVVLGDSHTESHQVAYDENFVSVAESILHDQNFDLNLRNHGKSYSSVADYVYLAPVIKEIYSPQAVVIQLSVQDFFKHEVYDRNKVNHFVQQDGSENSLTLVHNPPPFNDHWLGKLMQNTVILVQGTKRQRLLFGSNRQPSPAPAAQSESAPIAFDVIDSQLKMLEDAYAGVPVIILMLPYSPTVENNQLIEVEPEYSQVLSYFGSTESWHLINPSAGFAELYQQSGQLPRGFSNSLPGIGHLNVHGHRVVGELLAEQIMQIDLDTN